MLSKEQKSAVETDQQFIFLLAGAGSGKTRVIVQRIEYLLKQNIDASNILCITFTKKSADEMRMRINNHQLNIHTFHQLCYIHLKSIRDFTLIEHVKGFKRHDYLAISLYKNSLQQMRKPRKYKAYQKVLQNEHAIDFDDLLIEMIPHVRKLHYRYIFIDEFQDTNLLQYTLLEKMINKDTYVFAVGDPDQSIYAFRGSRIDVIYRYIRAYQAKILRLETNYRSNQAILDAANHLIGNNDNRFKKRLIAHHKNEGCVCILISKNDMETLKIIKEMIQLYKLKEIAILYRNHYQITAIKQHLHHHYYFHITFVTFHQSKGLEFDAVFMLNCEQMPYNKEQTHKQEEEERRLFFVAMTRAKRFLFLLTKRKNRFLTQTKIKTHI